MNKTIVAVMHYALLLTLLSFSTILAGNPVESYLSNKDSDKELLDRLNNIESIVDIKLSRELKRSIKMYVHDYPQGSEELLGRVSLYFPLFENKIREKNLPNDLKYLALIESALKANAKSKSGAAGLWQFMRSTGRMYGLEVNRSVDERYDPIKSTDAALDYLSDLHKRYGDWTLALAAYNCGPGNVNKAIRKAGGVKDYWVIRKYLPSETRNYVPRFIAATYLMKYYHSHNLTPRMPDTKMLYTATTKVYKTVKFKDLVKETGLTKTQIRFLNPSYIRNYIPNSDGGHFLTLPEESLLLFVENRDMDFTHVFKNSGSSSSFYNQKLLEDIAEIPRINMQYYNSENNVPVPMRQSISLSKYLQNGNRSKFYEYHKLTRRESIMDVVRSNPDVNLMDVLVMNEITLDNPPKAGSVIKIRRK